MLKCISDAVPSVLILWFWVCWSVCSIIQYTVHYSQRTPRICI